MDTLQDLPSNNWIKKCTFFLTGQTVSLFGSALVQYAISWHITITTESGVMIMISAICGFLPQVIISLFAGAWADRFDRKKMIILADGMIAGSTAVLAVLFTIGYQQIWLLFVIAAIRSVGAGIQTPAVSAVLPDIVPKEKLMRVNGIHSALQGLIMLGAPVAAFGVYTYLGLNNVFWIDVLTAAVGISLLLVLHVTRRTPPPLEQAHVVKEMLSGVRYVNSIKWLRQFLGFYMVFSLVLGPVVFLTPLMVRLSFGQEEWRLMAQEMAFGLGMAVGGTLASVFAKKFRNKIRLVGISCAVLGGMTVIMGFSQGYWFFIGVTLFMGAAIPFLNTGANTVLQTKVQPEFIGRVFGLVSIVSAAAMPLSMVIFGPLEEVESISIELLLIITGVFMALIALFGLRFKAMLAAGEPIEQDELEVINENERMMGDDY